MLESDYFSLFPNERFFELTMYQFGFHKCKPNHTFGPAAWNHFLFQYIFSGKGLLIHTNDKGETPRYKLSQGQGFMLWPGQKNHYIADSEDPWVYAWIEFDGLQARELVLKSGLTYNDPIYTGQNQIFKDKMEEELLHIITHAKNPPLELMGHFYLFMNSLIASSASRKETIGGSLKDFYVQEAIAYIERNYHLNVSVQDIADYCNLHRSYLNRIFKSVLSITPQQFIISFRIRKACELLTLDERPIGELCTLVGYPDQLNFSRAFKREMGVSPQQWRIKNRML